MYHKDYCSRCKNKNIPLIKYSRVDNTQYYMCRPCNSERAKKYRTTDKGKEAQKRSNLRTWSKHPDKHKARQAAWHAARSGKILKSPTCEVCGAVGRIEGHHMDYTKPLEVIWLCTSCHSDYHK